MKTNSPLNVAVIGAGLIGKKRAQCAAEDPGCRLAAVADNDLEKASELSRAWGARAESDWRKIVSDPAIHVVVVSTPNHRLAEIACAALSRGKHVLSEKPMGRNLAEAVKMRAAAKKSGRKLKVGFNHRYHPAIAGAREELRKGTIGEPLNIRAQYGHGGRKGYEKEWRGNFKLAGGGELTDQGVHLIDLIQWFCGRPSQAFALLQTAFWPVRPSEDNAFALLKYKSGLVANFHSSWTQWKNLFNLEVFGTRGFIGVNGLGGSYGPETLTVGVRENPGQVPDIKTKIFDGPDLSWKKEWADFMAGVRENKPFLGRADEGVAVMATLNALYSSHKSGKIATVKKI